MAFCSNPYSPKPLPRFGRRSFGFHQFASCSRITENTPGYATNRLQLASPTRPRDISRLKKVPLLKLRLLYLDAPYNPLLPWLITPGVIDFPNLKQLKLFLATFPLRVETPALDTLINVFSRSLETLDLWILPESAPVINLSQLKVLQSIRFKATEWYGDWEDEDTRAIPNTVATVNPSIANSLTVVVTNSKMKPPPSLEAGVQWFFDEWLGFFLGSDSSQRR